jgi:hypothetical protein
MRWALKYDRVENLALLNVVSDTGGPTVSRRPSGQFVRVYFQLENQGSASRAMSNYDTTLTDAQGRTYRSDLEAWRVDAAGVPRMNGSPQIAPSTSVMLAMLFDVAPDASGLVLHMQGGNDMLVATAAPTAIATVVLPTSAPLLTRVSSLLDLLVPIPGPRLQPTPALSNEVESFADYVPTDAVIAAKVEGTLVHLQVSDSRQTATRNIKDTRDSSAYPANAATREIRGFTVLEGWSNDRDPPSYFLGWVEQGAQTIEIYLDTAAGAGRTDRAAVKQEAAQVATALVGHMSR